MSVTEAPDNARQHLVAVARDLFAHAEAGTVPVADEVVEVGEVRDRGIEHAAGGSHRRRNPPGETPRVS